MTIDEQLAAKSEELDAFEFKLGLRPINPQTESEAIHLVEMPPDVLRGMSPQEASDAAYVLRQFALHLQRASNREHAAMQHAEEGVRRTISATMATMPAYSYEERRGMALRGNDAALKLDNARVTASLRLDRISYLSAKVSDLARTLEAKGQRPR